MDGPLEKVFNNSVREELGGEIVRMFYTSGLSFHFARNPYYVRAFTKAYNNSIAGYVPSDYNAFSEKTPINIMAIYESRPMFSRAINYKREYKDEHFFANLLIESIWKIGPQNVVQVITDNDAACKAAGLLVEIKFQHIFWTSCVVHTLNLVLKNICSPLSHPRYDNVMEQCCWILKISNNAMFIKKFIMNHSIRLTMFNDHSKLKLLSVAETPFTSAIVVLKRFKQIKQSLEHIVISERWNVTKKMILRRVNEKYATFSGAIEDFESYDSINDIDFMAPVKSWLVDGASTPTLQIIAFKLLGQPCSSSYCDRNWSTYNFIHSMRKNKKYHKELKI
ncbi:hypothetical protein JRO89_XS05G0153300 [Xanthoceras sorbifolium]|uniref:DUF659 domain-containing protein n=1 Tax=Xanthoceras sorbifolium TaxID=99658 RepID=A0ABQ8I2J2_9ROSI|nr:hypothetical protein JRO89_XS05G0153300 [Xanthoceras sorbifolium]